MACRLNQKGQSDIEGQPEALCKLDLLKLYNSSHLNLTEFTKHQKHLPNSELHPLCPQNRLNSSGHVFYKVSKAVPQGCWPMLTLMLPKVVSSWLDVLCVGDHSGYTRETVEREKLSSVAILETNWCAWHLLSYPIQRCLNIFVLPIHSLNTQSMSQLSQGLKLLLSPVSYPSSTLIEVDLTSEGQIRVHSFHLDSPGPSMSWKEQVFLMFCTLSVYCCDKYFPPGCQRSSIQFFFLCTLQKQTYTNNNLQTPTNNDYISSGQTRMLTPPSLDDCNTVCFLYDLLDLHFTASSK